MNETPTKTMNSVLPPAKSSSFRSMAVTAPTRSRRALGAFVDAHVHAHECFDPAAFFDHAAANIERARSELSASKNAAGCLLLTENPGDDFFNDVRTQSRIGDWRLESTNEPCSLIATRTLAAGVIERIVLVAGRQIVVREGIEVLAIGTNHRFQVGRSLKSTLERVLDDGVMAVLPWGFGKWWLKRGVLVRKVLESGFSSRIWLGDNGNRLQVSPEPRLFRLAAKMGVQVLPGSDPLPMPGRERDVGRYGFYLRGEVDLDRPSAWIRTQLNARRKTCEVIQPFGRREKVARFCISQVAMQWRRRG